jgi:MbtH protein
MNTDENEEETVNRVPVNHNEEFSIWPADPENVPDWRAAGKSGLKGQSVAHIKEFWTDMRPFSPRKRVGRR